MTNANNTVLHTGVTSNLAQRIWEHKNNMNPKSFSARYICHKLVWYEAGDSMEFAIAREKQIKGGSRVKKVALIETMNPEWRDLSEDIAE